MITKRGMLSLPVVLVASVGLLLAAAGCDDDLEEFFEDLEIDNLVGVFGGGYCDCGCSSSCGSPRCGWGDCGGYYYEEDYWEDWWW